MQHVLIIEDDVCVSSLLEDRLSDYGITSFAHAWTEDDAMRAARHRRPDLVVVCDGIDVGSGISAAHSISERYGVPALLVTGQAASLRRSLPQGCSLGGPFLLRELSSALEATRPC